MTTSTKTIETTKDQLISELNAVVSEAEHLLKSVAEASGDKTDALRTSVEQSLENTKEKLHDLQQRATKKTQAAAKATDEYVHANPWQAIGMVATLSSVIGLVVGLMLNRR